MYHIQEELAAFLFHHPSPNSLVVSSSSKGCCQHSTPPNKEVEKLNLFGRWLYLAGPLGIKSCNYIVCMDCFIHVIFEDIAPYLNNLPGDQKCLHSDGLVPAK